MIPGKVAYPVTTSSFTSATLVAHLEHHRAPPPLVRREALVVDGVCAKEEHRDSVGGWYKRRHAGQQFYFVKRTDDQAE